MRVLVPPDWRAPVQVASAVVRSCTALSLCAIALSAGCLVVAVQCTDETLAALTFAFLLHFTGGLLGSYVLHEAAHGLALVMVRSGVRGIEIDATAWRFSLTPVGTLTGAQVVAVALAGPLSTVAASLLLSATLPATGVEYWYMGHAVFLLPLFADGRAVLSGLRHWRSPREIRG